MAAGAACQGAVDTLTDTLTDERGRKIRTAADANRLESRRNDTGRTWADIRPVTLNLRVEGSIPSRLTTFPNKLNRSQSRTDRLTPQVTP
jgi:hypothetical protein